MGDILIISGLKEKRSAVAGQIIDLQRELDRLRADLFHIDSVLKLYGQEPSEIPTKGRMPKRSTYFGRNEITRRCYDLLRGKAAVRADDITVRAMREKGLAPNWRRRRMSIGDVFSHQGVAPPGDPLRMQTPVPGPGPVFGQQLGLPAPRAVCRGRSGESGPAVAGRLHAQSAAPEGFRSTSPQAPQRCRL